MDLSTREGRREQGERIKRAAKDAGLTLDELARRIGCSRALIYQYASGASLVQTDRLQQIAAVVGVPLYHFFVQEGEGGKAGVAAEGSSLRAEREALRTERERLEGERSRMEVRRLREEAAHLDALIEAYGSPPDLRRAADACQQLVPLLAAEGDARRLALLLLRQANALTQVQEWGAARDALERAAALFRAEGDHVSVGDCAQSLGHVHLMTGRIDEAMQQFALAAGGEDWVNRWRGTLSIGAAQEVLGEYAAAILSFERAMEIVEERGEAPETEAARLYVDANWANLDLDYGDYRSVLRRCERTVPLAQRLGAQDQYIEALLTQGLAHLHLGEIRAASASLRLAYDVAELARDQQHVSLGLACLSLYHSRICDPAAAIAEGKEALAAALRCGAVRAEMMAQGSLCEAYLVSTNPSEALYHAEQGLVVAQSMRLRHGQGQFGVLWARALLAAGSAAEASAAAEKALALCEELEARPLLLECRLTLAAAALTLGRLGEAHDQAAAAQQLAAAYDLPVRAWRGLSLVAQAYAGQGRAKRARDAFRRAISALEADRAAQSAAGEEETLLEGPAAIELWRKWIEFVLATEGRERAAAEAAAAEWPPLLEWLNSRLSEGGGASHA